MSISQALLTPQGDHISHRRIRQGLRLNVLAGSIGIIWITYVLQFPMAMFMEHLGASGLMIGLIGTCFQITMCVQIPATLWAERSNSRKYIWFYLALLHRLLLLIPLAALMMGMDLSTVAWITIITLACSFALGHMSAPLWLSWMADLVPDKKRSRFWASRQLWITFAGLVAAAFAGFILDTYDGQNIGFIVVFGVAIILGAIDLVIHLRVPEPKAINSNPHESFSKRILEPLKQRDFLLLCLSMAAWAFGAGIVGAFGVIYLERSFQVTYSQQALLMIVASLGAVCTSMMWGYIIDRIGSRIFGIISMVCCVFIGLTWFLAMPGTNSISTLSANIPVVNSICAHIPWLNNYVMPNIVWLMMPGFFLGGAFGSGVMLSQLNLCTSLSPKAGRSLAMAVFMTIIGVAGAIGPIIGGTLIDYMQAYPSEIILPLGMPLDFIHLQMIGFFTVTVLVAAPLLFFIRPCANELSISDALKRLIVLNPLRLGKSIYHIYMLSRGKNPGARAASARTLGQQHTAIAVSDLIQQLDDASTDVREQAVYALGAIGSPDAIDALICKLDDPHTDLNPHIARALRKSANTRSVDALIGQLDHHDRETQSESARTLGWIGDRRAAKSLLNILHHSKDTKVLSASSEALARLGEIAAIYDILPRMKETNNPILKRSLTVAIGDLLGEPERFYQELHRESEEPGTAVESMSKDIRKHVRKCKDPNLEEAQAWLIKRSKDFEHAYEVHDNQAAADALFDMAIGLSAFHYGIQFGGDAKALIDDLIWRNQRFGVGVWYLDLLRQNWRDCGFGKREASDLLLGIFFIHNWV